MPTIEVPINYHDLYRQSGVRRGKLCYSEMARSFGFFGESDDCDFACVNPPYQIGDKTSRGVVESVRIVNHPKGDMWEVTLAKAGGLREVPR